MYVISSLYQMIHFNVSADPNKFVFTLLLSSCLFDEMWRHLLEIVKLDL